MLNSPYNDKRINIISVSDLNAINPFNVPNGSLDC